MKKVLIHLLGVSAMLTASTLFAQDVTGDWQGRCMRVLLNCASSCT